MDKLSLVMQTNLDRYTDYLLSSFGQTSATNMARLMDDQISHDDVTRFLNQPHQIGQTLWKTVKPLVRKHQTQHGVLLVDDSLAHKPHSQESGLVSIYFDHTSGFFFQVDTVGEFSLWTKKGSFRRILNPTTHELAIPVHRSSACANTSGSSSGISSRQSVHAIAGHPRHTV